MDINTLRIAVTLISLRRRSSASCAGRTGPSRRARLRARGAEHASRTTRERCGHEPVHLAASGTSTSASSRSSRSSPAGCCCWRRACRRRPGGSGDHRPRLGRGPQRVQQPAAALVDVAVLHDHRLRPRLPGAVPGPRQLRGHARLDPDQAAARKRTSRRRSAYGPLYEKFAAQDIAALAKNPEALAIGQKLFLNNCAQCHASDGGGSRGFPNLTDNDWLWGGDARRRSRRRITDGRTGVMPPFGAGAGRAGRQGRRALRAVALRPARTTRSARARGKEKFAQTCVACHGAEGKGNPAIGRAQPHRQDLAARLGEEAIIAERHARAASTRCRRTRTC